MRYQPLQPYGEPLPGLHASELPGKLIVIEGPDSIGRSTQVTRLRAWLEQQGRAVVDTGMLRSRLTRNAIMEAKNGHTFGPMTMALFYMTDFADRLENVILPALRAGFVVLTDRYIYSLIARAAARGQDIEWLEQVAGVALAPHAVFYLRAEPEELLGRVVVGQGSFDYWESGMDVPFGADHFESFTRYQRAILEALDGMARKYRFKTVDAQRTPDQIFRQLQRAVAKLLGLPQPVAARRSRRPSVRRRPALP